MKIVISSGHGKYVRGASGILDEVNEARRVVEGTARALRRVGVDVVTYHDDVSTTQDQNLARIVDFHNAQGPHDLDISVHFNAYVETINPMGTECLYVSDPTLATAVSAAIADAGSFINRGPKLRDDLYFLNNTTESAILIETCFVDSSADAECYWDNFKNVCIATALAVAGPNAAPTLVQFEGLCSWFGGPNDTGVDPDEGLAFIYDDDDAPHLFLPEQPPGTTGLARRLDPEVFYVACRWDYDITPKAMLADPELKAIVTAGSKAYFAWPADWGPHQDTGRVADLSPALLEALGLKTDDPVTVIYPARRQ